MDLVSKRILKSKLSFDAILSWERVFTLMRINGVFWQMDFLEVPKMNNQVICNFNLLTKFPKE